MSIISTVICSSFFIFCILFLGTLSGIFSERAGIVNIAINGFIIFGATMYALITYIFTDKFGNQTAISPWWQILTSPLAALLTGAFAMVFGYTTIKLKSDQTISGFAMNVLVAGIALLIFLSIRSAQGEGHVVSFRKTNELAIGKSFTNISNLISYKTFVVIAIGIAAFFALKFTRWGVRFRSVGENPQASDVAGINVLRMKWQGIFISGFIAGMAGAIYSQIRIDTVSTTGDVQGLGFLALAIMITSQWKVHWAALISLMFSLLYGFSYYGITSIQALNNLKIRELFYTLPFLTTLVIMIFTSKRSFGPAAAGIPYDKSQR
ncbi:ABC transporter permease [Mycoplasmopsis pullorum]|uniref:ABC transporter permease n=1 Tax=Mycoplasmopsis pullorum TaxID=48003 RepID=UPI001119FADF|nr:ABC transporter permease [Mycoplasmopsis pullorum]TNK82856.1 ABC transporter permease [Mycoplasmopsis pullorum]TNK91700.1 ABC transporter permease [Mycoplasmopsis pullorum]